MSEPPRYVEVVFRRSDLYVQVWSQPVREVAKEYGISDVALSKRCRRMAIPLPPKGHWAKIAAGKAVKQPSLPPLPKGVQAEVRRVYWRRPKEAEAPSGPQRPPLQVEEDQGPPLVVPEGLPDQAHRLVRSTRRLLKPSSYSGEFRLVGSGKHLDVRVSPSRFDRSLRIFQGLLTGFEARGWRIEITEHGYFDEHIREWVKPDGKPGATRVRVNEEWVYLRLSEKYSLILEPRTPPAGLRKRLLERWHELNRPRRKPQPNGLLELVMEAEGSRRALKDGPRESLEEKLPSVPQELRWMAARAKQYRVEVEEQRQQWEEEAREQRIREDKEREAKLEREKLEARARARQKRFRHILARWKFARDARAYVEEARALLETLGMPAERKADLLLQLDWAAKYARRVDPLTPLRGATTDEANPHAM